MGKSIYIVKNRYKTFLFLGGREDLCICGSGKKYKKCCLK
ncbi:hypothetical protein CON94_09800 [Bacillus pseudomycoides]|nr:hypothetical protein CON94_09800 [Bacillus pseudomycoides]PEL87206.1 hypothetical protein CN615_13115 [Bacillus pseudomycoides]